jgi:hypothetical protein
VRIILAALDAVFYAVVWVGCVVLALSVGWQLALIVGGLLGLLAIGLVEGLTVRRKAGK